MAYMQEEQPLKPANILNIVAVNQGRRPQTLTMPVARPLSPGRVRELVEAGHVVIDARSSDAYGAGHVPGALNVQLSSSEFEQRVGWMTPPDSSYVLVADSADEAQRCVYNMAFIALDAGVGGFLEGGMEAWAAAGHGVTTVPQMDVRTLHQRLSTNGLQVLDVREREEWDEGHIEGAHFMPYQRLVPQLTGPAQIDQLRLTPDQAIAVTCATGKRSSTAIGILLRHGYQKLYNVTGGMEAWRDARLPMLDGQGNVCGI